MKSLIEKLLESPYFVLVIAVIFIGIGALGGLPIKTPMQSIDELGRNIFLITGAILLVVVILSVISPSKKSPKKYIYGLTIEKPQNFVKEVYSERPKIEGAYRKKPPEGMFRLFVYDKGQRRFWPQNSEFISWEKGRWTGSVRMGGGVGTEVIVFAALLPPSSQVLSDYYREVGELSEKFVKDKRINSDIIEIFKNTGLYWPSIKGGLPEDMVIIGEITIRKVAK